MAYHSAAWQRLGQLFTGARSGSGRRKPL